MLPELRFAWRGLRRAPAFAVCTTLTLALGVGANIGAWSALYTLLLKPLPYPEARRLVALYETTVDRKPRGVAEANLLDWRARTKLFDGMAAYQPRSFGLTVGPSDPVTVIQTGMVMAGFFPVVGVPPQMGRPFTEREEAGEAKLIVLTDGLWRRQFGADPGILNRTVFLNEEPYTVVGVMPPGFEYPMGAVLPEAFIPLSRRDYCCGRLGQQEAVARLRPGVSLPAAGAELDAVAAALAREYAATNGGRGAGLQPLQQALTGNRREALRLLSAAAALLLAIAVANVAGLILARFRRRARETAMRIALGAGAGRLARQFFAEAALWSAAASACGWAAAGLILRAVPKFVPGAAQAEPLRLEGTAFALAAVLAVALTFLLGLAPTLLVWRADPNTLIKTGGAQTGRGPRHRWSVALAAAQVALSVVLLLTAGVLLRSFRHLLALNPGFETAHALRFGIGLPEKRYDSDLKLIRFHRTLLRRLADVPGVERVGATGRLPLSGGTAGAGGSFQIAGSGIPMPQRPRTWINTAAPGYFAAMGIPLVEGRDFSWQDDRPGEGRVAIVTQAFVRAYLRGRPRLGTVLDLNWFSDLNPPGSTWQIVGVAADIREANLDRDPLPEVFLSMTQAGADGAQYVVRSRAEDAALPRAIARAVAETDPRLERVSPTPLRLAVERTLGSRQTAVQLVGAFGGLALLLTAVGIYGIVALRAAERSREMAIRSALGATAGQIRALVVGQGIRLAAAGFAAGLAVFLAAGPLLESQLYGVSLADPLNLAAVAASILAVARLASIAPCRRAEKAAPADLLRDA